jgi:hypothetical protein
LASLRHQFLRQQHSPLLVEQSLVPAHIPTTYLQATEHLPQTAAERLKLLQLAVAVRVAALIQMEKAHMVQEEEAVAVDIFSLLESL